MKYLPTFVDQEFEPVAFATIKEGDVMVYESGPKTGIYVCIGKTSNVGTASRLICRLQKLGDSVEALDPKTRMELAKLTAPKPMTKKQVDDLLKDKN